MVASDKTKKNKPQIIQKNMPPKKDHVIMCLLMFSSQKINPERGGPPVGGRFGVIQKPQKPC